MAKANRKCNKRMVFSINDAEWIGYPHTKRKFLFLTHSIFKKKKKSNWRIVDLNVKGKTIKLLENKKKYFHDLGVDKNFLKWTQKALTIMQETGKLDYLKRYLNNG